MNATESATYETTGGEQPRSVPPPHAAFPPQPAANLRDSRTKSPGLAAAFSLMPGLGQVYVGYYPRGFVNAVTIGGIISILASSGNGEAPWVPLLAMFMAFFWLYNIIDAARLAALYNRALAGGHEPALPDGFALPGMGGSILGGSILFAAGLLVLLHTRWGIRLDWVAEWWPVFPMLFGVYLVAKAVIDRGGRSERA